MKSCLFVNSGSSIFSKNDICNRSLYNKFRSNKSSINMIQNHYFSTTNRRNLFGFISFNFLFFNNLLKSSAFLNEKKKWELITMPVDTVLFDLDFIKNSPGHGWLVGAKGTFLETIDNGKTWIPRTFANLDSDEEINYRFENISFSDNDGWIIGKPAILLHTKDGGNTWLRVPISPKLPGEPILVTSLGIDSAEMTTSSGAIYVTTNGGRNWKAQIKETIDSTLNRTISSGVSGASYFTGSIIGVARDLNGKYLAISSRGNFFLTWQPEQEFWIPRARDTSRRIQSMGFIQNNIEKGIWMSTRGGGLSFTNASIQIDSIKPFEFLASNIKTGGYGILDVVFRNENEIWASCGGGILYYSVDKGQTWNKEKNIDPIAGNLYKIKFINSELGFAFGSNGILLKYNS